MSRKSTESVCADPVLEGIQDGELVASAASTVPAAMEAPARSAAVVSAATAMEVASTAVATTSTMELCAAAVVTTAAIAVAAVEVSASVPAIKAASIAAVAVIAVSTAVAVSSAVVAASVIAVIPRAGTDEDATDEPIRSVVSVGSAVVRGIIVVAVGADWRGAVIDGGADTNAEGDALGVGVGS
jgi:hypothetical protein